WELSPGGPPYLCKTVRISKEGLSVYGFEGLGPLLADLAESFRMHLATTFIFFLLGFAVIIGTTVNLLRDRYLRKTLQKLNDTLRVQAQHDSLTGLLNRRMFDEMAEAWFAQTLRLGVPFSLVLFDIDHFKRLNDAFGHQAGDHVLREIARCVSIRLSRRGDRVFRIGGEEFAVLASASEERQIVSLMEKIRKTVEDMRLQHPDGADKVVTISLGGLLVRDCCNMSFDEAFRRADEALYSAKAQGRNRSILADSCREEDDADCLMRPHS
uniref:GGDEF domain-containing protein n=1 Tax=Desulfovibrio sp. TaxID=885 RepID=UPI00262822DE